MKIEKPHFLQPDGLIDNASPRELYSLWNALVDSNNEHERRIEALSENEDSFDAHMISVEKRLRELETRIYKKASRGNADNILPEHAGRLDDAPLYWIRLGEDWDNEYECPECGDSYGLPEGTTPDTQGMNYCNNCGVQLEWREPDTQEPESELKPCPFCDDFEYDLWLSNTSGNGPTEYNVACLNCGSAGPTARSEAEAIAAWNRRAYEPELTTPFTSDGNKKPENDGTKPLILPPLSDGFHWEIFNGESASVESEPFRHPESGPEAVVFGYIPESAEVLRLRDELKYIKRIFEPRDCEATDHPLWKVCERVLQSADRRAEDGETQIAELEKERDNHKYWRETACKYSDKVEAQLTEARETMKKQANKIVLLIEECELAKDDREKIERLEEKIQNTIDDLGRSLPPKQLITEALEELTDNAEGEK